jgi:hypothetical protein
VLERATVGASARYERVLTTPKVSTFSASSSTHGQAGRIERTLRATFVGAPDQDTASLSGRANGRYFGGFLLIAALGACALPSRVHAQTEESGRWLVLPSVVTTNGDPKHPARSASRAITEQLRQHGTRAFQTDEAKTLFEQQGSTPPMTASAADIDELAKDAQRALYHVASGLPQRAKKDVERALERARRALESLNRETRAAQHLLDACLYLVRAHLQHNDRAEARSQALECRRLVPDIAPEPTVHPPDVIGVLAEAQAQLRAHEPPALRIESEPTGCAAYVNGRNLGPTPKELSQLSPGEYRLQVECEPGVMGRVHRLALVSSRVVAKVDTRYDRTIETLFDLSLHYASRDLERKHLGRDAVETARIVGATDVVVAWVEATPSTSRSQVKLDRYRVADGVHVAQATVSVDPGTGAIANEQIDRGRKELLLLVSKKPAVVAAPVTPPAPPPAAAAPPVEAMPEPAQAPEPATVQEPAPYAAEYEQPETGEGPSALTIAGYVAGGLGLVAHVASWVTYASLLDMQSVYTGALNANAMPSLQTSAELTALRDIDSADDPPVILGITGAALSTAALPMWLPETDGVTWWGWASGGAGLALAVTGAVLHANASSCEIDRYQRCTEPALATDLGPMLLLQAAPLIAVPIVQGVRSVTEDRASVGLQLGHRSAAIRFEGQW